MDTASILLSSPTIGEIEGDEVTANSRRTAAQTPPDYALHESDHQQQHDVRGIQDTVPSWYGDQSQIHAATMAEIDYALRSQGGGFHLNTGLSTYGFNPINHTPYDSGVVPRSYQTGNQMQQELRTTKPPTELSWGDWDVPLGRSQKVREHKGNVRYRAMVEQYRSAYLAAEKRTDKTAISQRIYAAIKSMGGRFLDKKKKTGKQVANGASLTTVYEWYEIPEEKAIAKVSQALRLGVAGPGNSALQMKLSYNESSSDELGTNANGEQNHSRNSPYPPSPKLFQPSVTGASKLVSPGGDSRGTVMQTTDAKFGADQSTMNGVGTGDRRNATRRNNDHRLERQNDEEELVSCPESLGYHHHPDDDSLSYTIDFSALGIDPTPVPCVTNQTTAKLVTPNERGGEFPTTSPAKR